ncbi:MAG: ribosome recycling factor [Candidatus Saccharibacteria bacterium]|uniref:Ribosome-recycling factor n=1 Tax=Candidatus Nanosyncoccus alces TaxID=2171997 RepID=A0ABY0FLI6_9BACT|nr:ribosome recycling factor [Candidatus Nanosyncoccus alces]MDO4398771.1 ribosome recycling factor [Candidatus Saccharibacteria bacterium]RYC74525.1 Ribosome-recycling factor [Candidatus Nanosyncoccus alces]
MFDVAEDRKKMEAVIERFKGEMKKVRTGRAHPDMLSGVKVEVYGQFMPLNQVANITAADATLLVITPFDPTNIQAIAAAIRTDQSLGLNPADDGRIIRVPIPALTEERRKEIVKNVSAKVEEAKVALRNVREDARKAVKIATEMGEDVKKRAEKEIDDLTKEFNDKVEAEFKGKSEEIMKL